MTNIVERLLVPISDSLANEITHRLRHEAAAEIERLRSASVGEKADTAYITSLVKQLNDKQNEIERLREQECQQHNHITGLLREIERLTETLAAAQAALTEYGDEAVQMRDEIERLRTETNWLRKHNQDLAAEIERLRAENDHFNAENEKAWNKIERLRTALQNLMNDVLEYERVNKLSPNPGKQDCWQSMTEARRALEDKE